MAFIVTARNLPLSRGTYSGPDNPITDPPIIVNSHPPLNPSFSFCSNPSQVYPAYTTMPVGPNGTWNYTLWTPQCVGLDELTNVEQLTGAVVPTYASPLISDQNPAPVNYTALSVGQITNPTQS